MSEEGALTYQLFTGVQIAYEAASIIIGISVLLPVPIRKRLVIAFKMNFVRKGR